MERFEEKLEFFAENYANMIGRIDYRLRFLSLEELEEIIELCNKPETTNCWWAVYAVAPIVKEKAQLKLASKKNKA